MQGARVSEDCRARVDISNFIGRRAKIPHHAGSLSRDIVSQGVEELPTHLTTHLRTGHKVHYEKTLREFFV